MGGEVGGWSGVDGVGCSEGGGVGRYLEFL